MECNRGQDQGPVDERKNGLSGAEAATTWSRRKVCFFPLFWGKFLTEDMNLNLRVDSKRSFDTSFSKIGLAKLEKYGFQVQKVFFKPWNLTNFVIINCKLKDIKSVSSSRTC